MTALVLGLSAPVPRGRKGKKVKAQSSHPVVQDADWLAGCNPDALFLEDCYKKHLKHHCNKYVREGGCGERAALLVLKCTCTQVCVYTRYPAVRLVHSCGTALLFFFLKHDVKSRGSLTLEG